MKFVLDALGIREPRYLDIGANHPHRFSNTFLFYELRGSGVLIEPNPRWTEQLRTARPRDACLEVGVAAHARQSVPFYVMKSDGLCTFSKREAERMVEECREEILEVKQLELSTPQAILSKHFDDGPNFVSLDVEGLELEILEAFGIERNRPEVFCIETISYAIDGSGEKAHDVIEFMTGSGYMVFADTYINTIFVDRSRWDEVGR